MTLTRDEVNRLAKLIGSLTVLAGDLPSKQRAALVEQVDELTLIVAAAELA